MSGDVFCTKKVSRTQRRLRVVYSADILCIPFFVQDWCIDLNDLDQKDYSLCWV